MQCPRCGGFHDGYAAPQTNLRVSNPVAPLEARKFLEAIANASHRDPIDRDVLPNGDGKGWEGRIYGVDKEGQEITITAGRSGTPKEGQTLAALGHIPGWEFYVHKNHDHWGPDKSADRGKS